MARCQPLWFGSADAPLFGWFHPAAKSDRGRPGLVLCSPFGYEAVCSHRILRELAETAAAAGFPTLRFDWAGAGDSAGDAFTPAQPEAWQAGLGSAVCQLQALSGADRVALAGIRLGATLAAWEAVANPAVCGLLAIAPVISPRSWLRELRALEASGARIGSGSGAAGASTADLESAGFVLAARTCATLAALDLSGHGLRAGLHVEVLDRADFPAADRWVEKLRLEGRTVGCRPLQGYREMMSSPHGSVMPPELPERLLEWLTRQTLPSPAATAPLSTGSAASSVTLLQDGRELRESAVFIGEQPRLFGVLTECAAPAHAPRRAILLLNAGATHHIGASRINVTLARRLARDGHVVLRVDQAGLGDSETRQGGRDNEVYAAGAVDDVCQAVEYLREAKSAREVVVAGLCSGAYHALKGAVAGARVSAVIPINPLTFFWKEGMSLDTEFSADRVVQDSERYRRNLMRPGAWLKLLSGRVNVLDVLQVIARRTLAQAAALHRGLARRVGLALEDDLGTELLGLAERGVGLHFLFADGDPGLPLLRAQGGAAVRRLQQRGQLDIQVIGGANHTFTPRSARDELIERLARIVSAEQVT